MILRTVLLLGCGSLAAAATAQTPVYLLHGDAPDDRFGVAVDGLGDLDGDGFGDLLAAAEGSDVGGANAGRVAVLSGATGLELLAVGGAPGEGLGQYAGRAGDVNADGTPDFQARVSNGVTRIFSGVDGALIHELPTPAGEYAADAAGDVSADGYGDVVIGRSNAADVWSGATGLAVRTYLGGLSFGQTVAGVGDVYADGYDDVAIGSPLYNTRMGKVEVFSGADSAIVHTFYGDSINVRLGWSLAPAGDADADGVPDVVAGAPFTPGSEQTGYARLFDGATGGAIQSYVGGGLENLGWQVDGAGDLDLDGRDDVLVASGSHYVRGYSPLGTTPLFHVTPPAGSYEFGARLSGVGRANHDAWPDFVVGDPSVDPAYTGGAWVLSGVPLALSADSHVLSLAAGGPQFLSLDSDAALAGNIYLVLGSFSGTSPGLPGFGLVLPLNLDVYLLHTLAHPSSPPLSGSLGVLDAAGDAAAVFALPAGTAPMLAGLTLHHAYAVLDPVLGVLEVSNAVPLSLVD